MANTVLIRFSLFYRLTWVQLCWPRATPDFGSVKCYELVSAPRHPKASWYTPFRGSRGVYTQFVTWFSGAYSRIYAIFSPMAALRGPLRGACAPARNTPASPIALRATDAETLTTTLLRTNRRVEFRPSIYFHFSRGT